jgi:hypothetical protein
MVGDFGRNMAYISGIIPSMIYYGLQILKSCNVHQLAIIYISIATGALGQQVQQWSVL